MAPVLQFRVGEEVRDSIDAAAEARGQKRSEWLRTAVAHALSAQSSAGGQVGSVGTLPVPSPAGEVPPVASPAPPESTVPNCPACGAPDGAHQDFCPVVTGEDPVTGEAPDLGLESLEEFVVRRTAELAEELGGSADPFIARSIAEAEWRKLHSPEPAQAPVPAAAVAPPAPSVYPDEACPSCGTMKSPTVTCRDCGRRPTITT